MSGVFSSFWGFCGGVFLFTVAAGSGAAVRHLFGFLDRPGTSFPLGLLLANTVGSFLFGFCLVAFSQGRLSENYKIFVLTAFLGALTTFSSFSGAAVQFLHREMYASFSLLFFSHNVCALFACYLGHLLANRWL